MNAITRRRARAGAWVSPAAAAVLAAAPTAGLPTAEMKLPQDFRETAARLPFAGYGGANRGRFTVDEYHGEFTRIESRLAIFDPLYASNRGTASFAMQGPGFDGSVRAECTFKQNVVTVGAVTFDPKKLTFVCEFSGGSDELPATLTLGQPRPEGMRERVLARAARRGVGEFGSTRIEIASTHEYERSRVQTAIPVGYLLTSGSVLVAALELTDVNPTVFLADDIPPPVRRSALLAAIAVSLLRDPADSALGD